MVEEKSKIDLKVQDARAITINDQSDYENAVDMLRGIKDMKKKLDSRYKPIQDATQKANQIALENIRDYDVPLTEAESSIKSSMRQYDSKKETEAKAETDRIEKELEEKERAKIKDDLKEIGLDEKEVEVEAAKIEVEIPIINIEPRKKVSGMHYRDNWTFVIENSEKLPREYMIPDTKKLCQMAKALKAGCNIPGGKAVNNRIPILK